MKFLREDLTISAIKYASIIGAEKSDIVDVFEQNKVPVVKKGEYQLNKAINALAPMIERKQIKNQIVSFFTHKGGVGKSLTSYNLASYLALLGYKTLLVDIDGQCNLSYMCGIDTNETDSAVGSVADLISGDATFNECVTHVFQNLDIIKGSKALPLVEKRIPDSPKSYLILRDIFLKNNVRENYDFVFFDNHSSFSRISDNAFLISDKIISIIIPDGFSLEGLSPVVAQVENLTPLVKQPLSMNVLVNNYNPAQKIQKHFIEEALKQYSDIMFTNAIKSSADFHRATLERMPFYCFSTNNSNALKDYSVLVDEFIARMAGEEYAPTTNASQSEEVAHES